MIKINFATIYMIKVNFATIYMIKPNKMESLLEKYGHYRICDWAAENGRLDVLVYTREHGCPWDVLTIAHAVENGHFNVVKWAHEHGCPWDSTPCRVAAEFGHFEILKWLIENGCPTDRYLCEYSARGGHVDIIQWLQTKGYELGPWSWAYACLKYHLNVLLWILQNNSEYAIENDCESKLDKFNITKKIIQFEKKSTFKNKTNVVAWITETSTICDMLFYNDLAMLIKNFI
jgi:hypothetical protein